MNQLLLTLGRAFLIYLFPLSGSREGPYIPALWLCSVDLSSNSLLYIAHSSAVCCTKDPGS